MNIQIANSDSSIESCFSALKALRPHLEKDTFLNIIKGMKNRGYHLIYIAENGIAQAVLGYRFTEHLMWGKAIYIDDLSTLPEGRGKGYASALLRFVDDVAKSEGCNQIHLDSGSNPGRYDAHRLYLNEGYNITSFHFAKDVSITK